MKRRKLLSATASLLSLQLLGCMESGCERSLIRDWLAETSNFQVMDYQIEKDKVEIDVGVEGNGGPYGFDPPGIVIREGTLVQWEVKTDGGHYRVVDECGEFESDDLSERGEVFERRFRTPGIYTYRCRYHDDVGMRGAIRVE